MKCSQMVRARGRVAGASNILWMVFRHDFRLIHGWIDELVNGRHNKVLEYQSYRHYCLAKSCVLFLETLFLVSSSILVSITLFSWPNFRFHYSVNTSLSHFETGLAFMTTEVGFWTAFWRSFDGLERISFIYLPSFSMYPLIFDEIGGALYSGVRDSCVQTRLRVPACVNQHERACACVFIRACRRKSEYGW